ncbi:hypothetical protein C8J56DRAFT_903353 [Mycena floridula]|nr:hypothetical protein C8J56DRAFT_903353 [Mycena floridula]
MKLDTILAPAIGASIIPFLSPKVAVIGTFLFLLLVTLLDQYQPSSKSLDALELSVPAIEKATRDTVTGSVLFDARFLIDVNESRRQNKWKVKIYKDLFERWKHAGMPGMRRRNIQTIPFFSVSFCKNEKATAALIHGIGLGWIGRNNPDAKIANQARS